MGLLSSVIILGIVFSFGVVVGILGQSTYQSHVKGTYHQSVIPNRIINYLNESNITYTLNKVDTFTDYSNCKLIKNLKTFVLLDGGTHPQYTIFTKSQLILKETNLGIDTCYLWLD